MTQRENELAQRIARLLDAGAGELDQRTVDRLSSARREALARYENRQRAPAWSWVTATAGGHDPEGRRRHSSLRMALLAAVVVSAIAIGVTWHSGSGSEIADIDVALLTDELPINAFLDQGFDSWLKRASR